MTVSGFSHSPRVWVKRTLRLKAQNPTSSTNLPQRTKTSQTSIMPGETLVESTTRGTKRRLYFILWMHQKVGRDCQDQI
jgi:hypothetical protein